MNKKAVIAIVLSAVIVLGGICTYFFLRKDSPDLLSTLEEDQTQSAKLDPATLTFYLQGKQPDIKTDVQAEVEKKIKNKLNANLDFKYISDNGSSYIQQLESIIAAGQPCDAFFYSQYFPDSLESLVKQGMLKDLTSLFPKYAPGYLSKFKKDVIPAMSVDGKLYAIPHNIPSSNMRSALVQDRFMKKYNIPDIKSYSDYEFYLKTVKEKEPGIIPTTFNDTVLGLFAEANGYVILDYQEGLVYKWDDPEMKLMAWEQTPEFKKGIKTLHEWAINGYISDDSAIAIGQISKSHVTSGKWASFIVPFGTEFSYNSYLLSSNIDWRYKAYPLYPDQVSERISPMDVSLVISAQSKNAERTLMFIEWLQSSQENYDSLMYGRKGTDYLLDGDKVKLPKGIKYEQSFFNWGWRYAFSNIDWERPDGSTDTKAIKDYMDTLEKKTKYAPHLGFTPDYTAVSDIADGRRRSFFSTESKIVTGIFTDEDIEKYVEEQKTQGADALVAEIQKQLNAWKAKYQK